MDTKIHVKGKLIIAAFDFDGTITLHDSLPKFLRFKIPFLSLLWGIVHSVVYVLLYKLHLMPNYEAKEKLFKQFFKGMHIDEFNERCAQFKSSLEGMIRPEAIKKIAWHNDQGHEVVIVSASIENWIIPWASQHGIRTVLATKIEIKDNLLTGKFLSKNCYGPEKLARLLQKFPQRDSYELYAYGDTNGDKELLAAANHAFYRKF